MSTVDELPFPQVMFKDGPPSQPRFVLGFDGETEFTFRGKRYAARHHPTSGTWMKPECIESTNRLVGCVYGESCDTRHDWPPAELMAHFPGWRKARYAPTGTKHEFIVGKTLLLVDDCEWEFV